MNFFTSLFNGNAFGGGNFGSRFGNMLSGTQPDPWAGLRNVGDTMPQPMTMQQHAHGLFGGMQGLPGQQQPAQFSPVQFGGAPNGNGLSQILAALMKGHQQ